MKKTSIIIVIIALGIFSSLALWLFISSASDSSEEISAEPELIEVESEPTKEVVEEKTEEELQLPDMENEKIKNATATLKTTEGEIVIELFVDKTPITANNFITLANKNFYDKTIFHRVMKGFMIQGGCPDGNGTGGPGYKFDDEPFEGEYTRGTVAMANAGPNTNGSQFFIMHQDYALPKNYVIFGRVIEGLEVVDKIATAEVKMSFGGEMSTPVTPVALESVEVKQK